MPSTKFSGTSQIFFHKNMFKKVLIIVIIIVAGIVGYFVFSKDKFAKSYASYAECVENTNLPCKHYFVGDFGQEWRPSPYLSKEECDSVDRVVGFTCVVSPGNFRESRWINASDLERANREASTQNTNPTNSTTFTWKETVYTQFKNLADWRIEENLSDWRTIDLDRSQLNKFPKGKIFQVSKSFNETGFPGPNVDQQIQQAASDQQTLENSVKKVLTENGWKFVAGPTEGGFYHDYLYVKDNHPLILQIGTRDAITGGMYISIQFLY